jgi:zinc transporter 1/2/3
MTNCETQLASLNNSFISLESKYEECGCNLDPCNLSNGTVVDNFDLRLHIGAVFIILCCSFSGVAIPIFGRKLKLALYPLTVGKHFGTGILIACALVHMLLPANEALTSDCLGTAFTQDYQAYAFLFCTLAILAMHSFDTALHMCAGHKHGTAHTHTIDRMESITVPSSEPGGGAAAAESSDTKSVASSTETHLQAYMLEFGFTVHSIFIGIAVGVATDNFPQLLTALVFHQFFEGIGLGSRLADPAIKLRDALILGLIFAVSAPFGIMLGTILRSEFAPDNQVNFLLSQGILDAICAGILLYVGFILLLQDFPKDTKVTCTGNYARLKLAGLFVALWGGAGLMAFIGKYL